VVFLNLAFSERCRYFFPPTLIGFCKSLEIMNSRYVKLYLNSLSCRMIIRLSKNYKGSVLHEWNPINTLRFWRKLLKKTSCFNKHTFVHLFDRTNSQKNTKGMLFLVATETLLLLFLYLFRSVINTGIPILCWEE